jgi:hypothetical protein
LIQQVPWLSRAASARVAWVIRDVADAGWTLPQVMGWLTTREVPDQIGRPVAFLAARLAGAVQVTTTVEQRERLAEAWRDDLRAAAGRHAEWAGGWAPPRARQVQALVADAFAGPAPEPVVPGAHVHGVGDELLLDDLAEHELFAVRSMAKQRPDLVRMAVQVQGEAYARRLYTSVVVDRALAMVPRPRPHAQVPRPRRIR